GRVTIRRFGPLEDRGDDWNDHDDSVGVYGSGGAETENEDADNFDEDCDRAREYEEELASELASAGSLTPINQAFLSNYLRRNFHVTSAFYEVAHPNTPEETRPTTPVHIAAQALPCQQDIAEASQHIS
ncbi:hypothetical protein P153DRAFT_401682, partial [Dothidotthia symphoricarpi CBS 119687]